MALAATPRLWAVTWRDGPAQSSTCRPTGSSHWRTGGGDEPGCLPEAAPLAQVGCKWRCELNRHDADMTWREGPTQSPKIYGSPGESRGG